MYKFATHRAYHQLYGIIRGVLGVGGFVVFKRMCAARAFNLIFIDTQMTVFVHIQHSLDRVMLLFFPYGAERVEARASCELWTC